MNEEQATPQPVEVTPQPATPVQPVGPHDPGKTLGIVGFIFAFVGLQIIGLILSIIGFKKSKSVGIKNTLAFAGIILNSVLIGLALILIPIFLAIGLVAFQGVSKQANSVAAQSAALEVVRGSVQYYLEEGVYPTRFSDISADLQGDIIQSPTKITAEPDEVGTIEFYDCDNDGIKVGFWDTDTEKVEYVYDASDEMGETWTCVLVAS